ncbi:DNA primase [Streptomyces sp. HUAS TT20]|uniref:DNA primase n=1 Tax=Streptomyces sp. HUAS TT20 TaxID=3447509 RepID=UPI0021DA7208|nr:DNA primase [Streptomyces sp. HUAS 15-9]UXY30983.1 DNA primase [Streptomyces sp. HUAS 15-9]
MNRTGLGLALGAGYVLGRTKKAKLAFALGTLAAGKRLHLSPRALADLASQQLRDNPQFKEIGDQLREDLRGVGQAASGAMVERQMEALADRLHGRTADVRDQLSGLGKLGPQEDEHEEPEAADEEETEEAPDERKAGSGPSGKEAARKAPARKAPSAARTAKKAPARKTGQKAPARRAGAKDTDAKKKRTTGGSAARGARTRLPKGGDES